MSDIFDGREKGYEAQFKLDEELTFKVEARRNKLLGMWLAEKFGLDSEKADKYIREVVVADMDEPGIEDVIRKVMADIQARGINLTEQDIRDKIEELDVVAKTQLLSNNNQKIE